MLESYLTYKHMKSKYKDERKIMYIKFQQKKTIIFTVIFSMLILVSCTESTQDSSQIEDMYKK